MSNSHTPGPWTAFRNDHYWEIQTEAHGQIGDACSSSCIYINGTQIPDDEAETIAEANAHLMAAAPELLEMVQKLIARLELYVGPDGIHAGSHDKTLLDEAYPLIARAEGR